MVFRSVAQTKFDDAASWYEAQRPGLGADFVFEVERILGMIASQPDRYPFASGGIREGLVRRFPYCVYYRVKPNRVVILAVIHASRDPAVWQSRI